MTTRCRKLPEWVRTELELQMADRKVVNGEVRSAVKNMGGAAS